MNDHKEVTINISEVVPVLSLAQAKVSEGFWLKVFLKGILDIPQLHFFTRTLLHKCLFNSKKKKKESGVKEMQSRINVK